MRAFILADNQELTRFALEGLIRSRGESNIFRASDKAGLVELLKEHENAVVRLDYTMFDFADENQLLIVAERFALSQWILISDELTPQFLIVGYDILSHKCRFLREMWLQNYEI